MKSIERYSIEDKEEWRKWISKIPKLKFLTDWEVRIIPPFGGALVRFQVFYNNKSISVYLDVFENLGYFGEPYWEIYPYEDDIYRIKMDDSDQLIKRIQEEFNRETFDE